MDEVRRWGWTWLEVALLVLVLVVLVFQLRLLYIFPQPDSARWWGDETGQMLELKAELESGVAHIPSALGSSLAVTNGFIRGNSWAAAIVYGVPVYVFEGLTDVVTVGRTVTALLSLLLLVALARLVFKVTYDVAASLFAVLVLVTTRAFFYGSHAARLDVAAGLAIVVAGGYLLHKHNARRHLEPIGWQWWFIAGACYMALSTLSIHLLTIGAVIVAFLLWQFKSMNVRSIGGLLCGVLVVLGIILAIYGLSGAPPTLFTKTATSNQFESVAYGLPIMRPFSRSVQLANILQRGSGFRLEAPALLGLALIAIVVLLFKRSIADHRTRFLVGYSVAVFAAWMLLENSALYYYMQVIPIFVAALVAVIFVRKPDSWRWVTLVAGLILVIFAVRDAQTAGTLASELQRDNSAALSKALRAIDMSPIDEAPIVLAQNPAVAELYRSTSLRLMTPHFLSFPISTAPVEDQLSNIGVDFVLLYSVGGGGNYTSDYTSLHQVATTHGLVLTRWTGKLFDVGRDYFKEDTARIDTLTLYRFVR
jgi:hypothetical protein